MAEIATLQATPISADIKACPAACWLSLAMAVSKCSNSSSLNSAKTSLSNTIEGWVWGKVAVSDNDLSWLENLRNKLVWMFV